MTDPSKYLLNHTMLRVKDPAASLKFYEFLGMKQIDKIEQPDAKFDLYFLAYDSPGAVSHKAPRSDRQGIIELTHNYESPKEGYTNGNTEPHKGFGHVCISVDNIQAACKRLEDAGYKFQKKLTDGRMKSIAFALDPDGYWVEIIPQRPIEQTENEHSTNVNASRMDHTMIRVKDAKRSLAFYQDVMGMSLKRTSDNTSAGFTLYFLGYGPAVPEPSKSNPSPQAQIEGLLELTHNHGTEDQKDFKYHNGNDEPQGFGHICVSVDNIDAACQRFDQHGVQWKKKLTDGRMRNIAFVLDPDNYWIEVIQNERIKSQSS